MNTHSIHEHESARRAEHVSELKLASMAERLAGLQRISWREALGLLAGAPFRIHHYRDVHTRMLHEALCELDCRGQEGQEKT